MLMAGLPQYYRTGAKSHWFFMPIALVKTMSGARLRESLGEQTAPARCSLRSSGGISMNTATRSATASEIIEIVGHLEDGVIARILATGASPAEVLEAFTWATADDQIGTELRHTRHGITGEVYEILMQEDPDEEEFRR
jgi:hypothetical protein